MKISNHNKVHSYMYLIIVSIITFMAADVIVFLLQVPRKEILCISIAVVILILMIAFVNLKIFIYEDSQEIITIKRFHPMEDQFYGTTIEFPKELLRNYVIERTFQGIKMTITLESSRQEEVKKEFYFWGFKSKQLNKLLSSLENTGK